MKQEHRPYTYRYTGSTLKDDFDEMVDAVKTGIPCIHRDECFMPDVSMLATLMRSTKIELFIQILRLKSKTVEDLAHALRREESEVLKIAKHLHSERLIKLVPILYDTRTYTIVPLYDSIRFEIGPWYRSLPSERTGLPEFSEKEHLQRFSNGLKNNLLKTWPTWERYLEPISGETDLFKITIPSENTRLGFDLVIETEEDYRITVWHHDTHAHFGLGLVPDDEAYNEAINYIRKVTHD